MRGSPFPTGKTFTLMNARSAVCAISAGFFSSGLQSYTVIIYMLCPHRIPQLILSFTTSNSSHNGQILQRRRRRVDFSCRTAATSAVSFSTTPEVKNEFDMENLLERARRFVAAARKPTRTWQLFLNPT
jgi:hypothetical protein